MEIQESNKLIAEFIGRCGKYNKSLYTFKGIDKTLVNDIWYNISEAKFHSSWDWLMPVIEKIETKGYIVNVSSYPSIERSVFANLHITPYNKTQYTKGNRLERTFQMVVEFIKWYNKQKTK